MWKGHRLSAAQPANRLTRTFNDPLMIAPAAVAAHHPGKYIRVYIDTYIIQFHYLLCVFVIYCTISVHIGYWSVLTVCF